MVRETRILSIIVINALENIIDIVAEVAAKERKTIAKWELANQAKKDARATIGTMYNRVKSYAFESEKTSTPKKTFVEKLSKLVEDCANLKDADFDIVACMKFLVEAEKVAKNIK